jgi:hypothetical protein
MIYRKIYYDLCACRRRVMVADEDGDVLGEIMADTADVADAAANGLIAALQARDAKREHVRMHTIGDEVVEIGTGSGEGE